MSHDIILQYIIYDIMMIDQKTWWFSSTVLTPPLKHVDEFAKHVV